MVVFEVEDGEGRKASIEVPQDINLNLMEVLKASEYPIAATCGGIALCATCYVEVEHGMHQLDEPTMAELDMLDTLPSANSRSRLACQIKISSRLQNAIFKLKRLAD